MTYNLTMPVNATFYDFAVKANDFSGTLLFGGFMIGFFVLMVLVIGERQKENLAAVFALSGFVSFLVSVFLVVAELLNFLFPIGFLTVTAFSVLYLYLEGK